MPSEIPPIRPDFDHPNYDKSRIAPYTLEDPLRFLDGTPVRTPAEWPRRRREILDLFAREMYGVEPPPPEALETELVEEKVGALAGFAVRSQYQMWFRRDRTGPCVNWLLYRPRYATGPVPVILMLNYHGNHEFTPDPEIPVTTAWLRNDALIHDHHSDDSIRGRMGNPNSSTVMPIGMILARGYALMTACYGEVSPDPTHDEPAPHDQEHFPYTGVFELWPPRDPAREDNTTSLGAWAWALSRGLDLAQRIPELDATRALVTGCSRLGKSALLAAARDERFAVCVPNQCGGGGVCLAKRDYGECVGTENWQFTHWYCQAYRKYSRNPAATLTFDQHLLLAAIAPRRVLVEGYDTDQWMDTEGEYLACRAAAPVWEFLGQGGMPGKDYPDNYDTSCIGPNFGYVRRSEAHGLAACDWCWTLDFADRSLKR